MAYWLDYSAAKIAGSVIRAAGYAGVLRYIDSPVNWRTKTTNDAEYASHKAARLDIRLVMEVNTADANGGRANGIALAKRAKAGADALGYTGVIYFCNDTPSLPSSTLWDDFLTGAASVLGWSRVGAYGFANAMDIASHMTECKHFWQAGRRSDVRPFVQIWQDNNTQVTVGGITCDRNLILKSLEDTVTPQEIDDLLNFPIKRQGAGQADDTSLRAVAAYSDFHLASVKAQVAAVAKQVSAVQGALTAQEAKLLAAIATIDDVTGQVDVAGLANALLQTLPDGIADALGRKLITKEN